MAGDILDWIMDHIMGWVVVVVMLAVVGLFLVGLPCLAYYAWRDSNSPTVELNKSEWACTQTQTIPVTTYVLSGKIMVPITTYSRSCTQWNRQP